VRLREYGVRAADLDAQRAALMEFAAEMYRPLVRCDQRAKGEQYVRGLLLEGGANRFSRWPPGWRM
jgi:hypothetical protein